MCTNRTPVSLVIHAFRLADVIFGFERTELEVGEEEGSVEVCVVVFNPGQMDALEATITFNLQPQPGTAGQWMH